MSQVSLSSNRAKLANSAMAALQTAQKAGAELGKRDSDLANGCGIVSQGAAQVPVITGQKTMAGGPGGIKLRTLM